MKISDSRVAGVRSTGQGEGPPADVRSAVEALDTVRGFEEAQSRRTGPIDSMRSAEDTAALARALAALTDEEVDRLLEALGGGEDATLVSAREDLGEPLAPTASTSRPMAAREAPASFAVASGYGEPAPRKEACQ